MVPLATVVTKLLDGTDIVSPSVVELVMLLFVMIQNLPDPIGPAAILVASTFVPLKAKPFTFAVVVMFPEAPIVVTLVIGFELALTVVTAGKLAHWLALPPEPVVMAAPFHVSWTPSGEVKDP